MTLYCVNRYEADPCIRFTGAETAQELRDIDVFRNPGGGYTIGADTEALNFGDVIILSHITGKAIDVIKRDEVEDDYMFMLEEGLSTYPAAPSHEKTPQIYEDLRRCEAHLEVAMEMLSTMMPRQLAEKVVLETGDARFMSEAST